MSSRTTPSRCAFASCVAISAEPTARPIADAVGCRDHDVLPGRDGNPPVGRHDADRPGLRLERPLAPGHVHLIRLDRLGRRQRRVERVDPAQQAAELEAAEDLLERGAIRR